MRIAILGATSEIAKDLIVSFHVEPDKHLYLFARQPDDVKAWLVVAGLNEAYPVDDFSGFAKNEFDVVINFIGVGNPAQAQKMGSSIFEVTLRFDEMVLDYLKTHPFCRYLFLSSGAAYGSCFNDPVTAASAAVFAVNELGSQDWYGVAKLHAECRHRAHAEFSIIDIRVFNYFSRTQDMSARFLITDIIRAIRDKSILKITADNVVRDYLHPSDFFGLISVLLAGPRINIAVDAYSRAPIDKLNLLVEMHKKFGLLYEPSKSNTVVNATGSKPRYYSLNDKAASCGYKPKYSSLTGIMKEFDSILVH